MFRSDVLTIGVFLFLGIFHTSLVYSTFFNECPGKDVPTIRKQAFQSELSLILYYVPWNKESLSAKNVYNEVAQYYHNQVNFAAVNCWHLECNCSYTFPSVVGGKSGYPRQWPTLMARYGREVAVKYRGDWNFATLSRFLDNIFQPVRRLYSKDDLKLLTMHSNAVVLGLFPNAAVIEYRKFCFAAVKWIENDPPLLVRFAVSFDAVAEEIVSTLGVKTPLIALISDKEVQIFNSGAIEDWQPNHLLFWLQSELKRISKHFIGYSIPPILADHVRRGTVLAIFTNELKSSDKNFYFQMENIMSSMGFTSLPATTTTNIERCEKFWRNYENDNAQQLYVSRIKIELHEKNNEQKQCTAKLLLNTPYNPYNRIQLQYSKNFLKKFQPSVQQQAEDWNSAENLLDFFHYTACLKVTNLPYIPEMQTVIAKLLTKFIEKVSQNSPHRHNRTISVQFIDMNKHKDILYSLGVANTDIADGDLPGTALIIEPNQEGVYILRKQFHYETLLNFIRDYYYENLVISRKTSINLRPPPPSSHSISSSASSSLSLSYNMQELSRQMFLNALHYNWHNTTTIVLLFSPRCAFSSLMSHALMQVSVLLHNKRPNHHINIIRLNTQTNDLPWEFIMPIEPSLIVFPRGRPTESRIFPSNLKIDVRNVFGFILSQLEPIEQIRVALGSCSLPTQQLLKCLHFVKTLAMQHISEHLKLWQIFENERQDILARLKQFKDITLDIQESFKL